MAKFEVGDVVRRVRESPWPDQYGEVGSEYTVLETSAGGGLVVIAGQSPAMEWAFELVKAADVSPHIVAIVSNGRPQPATVRPKVHPDRAAAMTEAKRLAAAHPGETFAIYARVGAAIATVELKEVA